VIGRLTKLLEIESDYWRDCISVFVFGDPEIAIVAGSALRGVGGWEKEKSHGRILLARLADRFRSPWKQTSEETMALVFSSSDSPDLSSRSALPDRHVP
jgi:hypothetical protein